MAKEFISDQRSVGLKPKAKWKKDAKAPSGVIGSLLVSDNFSSIFNDTFNYPIMWISAMRAL
jgi:hypothetical protein